MKNFKEILLILSSLFLGTWTLHRDSQIQGNTFWRLKQIPCHQRSQFKVKRKAKLILVTFQMSQRFKKCQTCRRRYQLKPSQWMDRWLQANTSICLLLKIRKLNSCRLRSVWRSNLTQIRSWPVLFWISRSPILHRRDLSVQSRM